MRKILAVAGQPGTGKTTLFRKFMANGEWQLVEPQKLVSSMYNAKTDTFVLGKYIDGEVFAGTDRLSMNAQPSVQEFVRNSNSNIIFEGDRLTNGKFYDFLLSLPDTKVKFFVLEAKPATLKQRYADRGSNQSETFLKGRETKIANITSNFEYMDYTEIFKNENLEDQKTILKAIEDFFS